MKTSEEFKANPIGQFVDPDLVAADHAGGLSSPDSRPRRWPAATRQNRHRAHEVIAGYTIANDVSVRDWQVRTPTMTMGKSFDTHGPLGPWIVTQNELGEPHDLQIRTYVNDELRQDGNTGEMIYDCYQQVAHLSQAFTLEPGDVIATGTPAGIGAVRQPFPEGLLKVGDIVRIEIERIGELRNTVVEEPDGYLAPEAAREFAWVQ